MTTFQDICYKYFSRAQSVRGRRVKTYFNLAAASGFPALGGREGLPAEVGALDHSLKKGFQTKYESHLSYFGTDLMFNIFGAVAGISTRDRTNIYKYVYTVWWGEGEGGSH
jgi:hypothetical protein